jgi:hypothetical protein
VVIDQDEGKIFLAARCSPTARRTFAPLDRKSLDYEDQVAMRRIVEAALRTGQARQQRGCGYPSRRAMETVSIVAPRSNGRLQQPCGRHDVAAPGLRRGRLLPLPCSIRMTPRLAWISVVFRLAASAAHRPDGVGAGQRHAIAQTSDRLQEARQFLSAPPPGNSRGSLE